MNLHRHPDVKTLVVMQPTYLPWAGYFNLMAEADVFVFLDDVQFEKSSWQHRNRVLVQGEPHWLTVPVCREHLADPISAIQTDGRNPWHKKHLRLISQSYAKHPYHQTLVDFLAPFYGASQVGLADLNTGLITGFAERLGLEIQFMRAKDLGITGPRTRRLVEMAKHFGCNRYLSPKGAQEYLESDGDFSRQTEVELVYQEFVPQPYPQWGRTEFSSHLSMVDVVANLGWAGAAHYVRTGMAPVSCVSGCE